jgi:hypothetical protein
MRILSTTVTLSIWIASAQAHMCTLCNHADKPPDSFARLSVNRSYLDEFWSYVYVREPAPYANSTNNTNIESPLWSKPGAPMYIPVLPEEETYRALMKAWPQTTQDILTVNHRCGRDAWNTSLRVMPTGGYKVFTRDVLAGDELSFLPERYSVGDQHYDYIGHVGPGMVYLAKKPDGVTLTEWDGDGDWFKIDYRGPKDNVNLPGRSSLCFRRCADVPLYSYNPEDHTAGGISLARRAYLSFCCGREPVLRQLCADQYQWAGRW